MANVHIKVPQKDGQVSISFAGDEPRNFNVTDGQISVPEDLASRVVAAVDGASIVNAASPAKKE